MGNPDASPAQKDPCEVCDQPLNKYGICPCIEHPALCTGAPVPGEIFDNEDAKWRSWSLMAQLEDFNEVAIRIKWDLWDWDNNCCGDESPEEPHFTWCEVSPSIAMRFAIKIATVAVHVWIASIWYMIRDFLSSNVHQPVQALLAKVASHFQK